MGVMVFPSCTDQPESILIYRSSHDGFNSPVGIDAQSILLQKMVCWAESRQVGAEWPIPAVWFEKAEGLRRMADNPARATGKDRRVKLMQDRLRCVPWNCDE